jgi:hypothetical protein
MTGWTLEVAHGVVYSHGAAARIGPRQKAEWIWGILAGLEAAGPDSSPRPSTPWKSTPHNQDEKGSRHSYFARKPYEVVAVPARRLVQADGRRQSRPARIIAASNRA